jgi:mycothiol synthase
MSLPLPDGVVVRALRAGDAAAVAELLVEDDRHFGLPPSITEQDVRSWWLRTDLDHDSWLLEENGASIAGGWFDRLDDHAFGGGCVRPGEKGRGLGSWLVETMESHASGLGLNLIRNVTTAKDEGARTLFEGRGYKDARRHWVMAIELDEEPPAPELPDGLALETFREEDARAFHDATKEAFADEWGFHAMAFEQWWEMRKGDDTSLWFVIRDGSEIAANARCDEMRGGGFVGSLAVRRPWRRRGLGRALLLHAFSEFKNRGYERASLGVDSENPTGATRLYESVGMHVESEHVTFEKELA